MQAREKAPLVGLSVKESDIHEGGFGCFVEKDVKEGLFPDADGTPYRLPVVKTLPCGTDAEKKEVESWENDKFRCPDHERRNKYWPVTADIHDNESLVVFNGAVLTWGDLVEADYSRKTAYPGEFASSYLPHLPLTLSLGCSQRR